MVAKQILACVHDHVATFKKDDILVALFDCSLDVVNAALAALKSDGAITQCAFVLVLLFIAFTLLSQQSTHGSLCWCAAETPSDVTGAEVRFT
jgi:hypothetical protein